MCSVECSQTEHITAHQRLVITLPQKNHRLLGGDLLNLELCERLSMTDIASIPNFALVLDHGNFFRSTLFKHGCLHFYAANRGCSHVGIRSVFVGNQKDVKLNRRASFQWKFLNLERLSLRNQILLSSGLDHCNFAHISALFAIPA